MAADKRGPLGSNDGSDSKAETNAKRRGKKPAFKVETLEQRILMSATWADAETGEAQSGATDGNDVFTGDELSDFADGGAGNDVLSGLDGNDTLLGGEGNDALLGGEGDDVLTGGVGDDVLSGGGGADTASYSSATGGVNVNLAGSSASGADGNDTLTGIENVTGSAHADTLVGDSGANTLSGGGGNDQLSGGGGNDNLQGGSGDDSLVGGLGDDAIDGGSGIDLVSYAGASGGVNANLASGSASGADGNDTIANVENLTGSAFNDTLTGNSSANLIEGGSGNDNISGNAGDDTLIGGEGNDFLDGDEGADTLLGGAGNDRFEAFSGNDIVDGGEGSDTLDYSAAAAVNVNLTTGVASGSNIGTDSFTNIENVTGSQSGDTLTGDSGNNVIDGGSGNDTIAGGLGNDTLIGGGGTDTLSYAGASGGVNVNLTTNLASGADGNDTLSGFENVTGSAFDDTIVGSTAANVIDAGAGNDSVTTGDGNDTITGGSGNDTIDAGGGDDTVNDGAGDDTLVGGSGTDTLSYSTVTSGVTANLATGNATGGSGNDTISGFENLTGGSGNDALTGDANANRLIAGSGNDALSAGDGDDYLRGDAGNDTIDGGTGIDTASYENAGSAVNVNLTSGNASGGDGSDTLTNVENLLGSNHNDTLTGDAGANTIEGRGGNDAIDGGAGVDTASYASAGSAVTVNLASGTATGGAGSDTLSNIENVTGSNSNDTITGDAGANVLSGGGGNDTIEGGLGDDTIDGGTGTDKVSYANASGSVNVNLTTNTATGAAGSDTLSNVEDVLGSSFDDVITGNSGANTIEGGGGNDVLDGAGGTDTVTYAGAGAAVNVNLAAGNATGGAGSDTLSNFENATGSNFDDVLTGNSGNNVLTGGSGNDTLIGGLGNDTLAGGAGVDLADYSSASGGVTVTLTSAGNGTASGADGSDTLSGIENITGSAHADTLTGDSGANVINAGSGNDTVNGGGGNDTLIGGAGTDTVTFAGASSGVNVNLAAGTASGTSSGTDTLSGFENVTGTDHADTLAGDSGANVLSGGAGNDTLVGTSGNDTLSGGSGTDTADYTSVGSSVNADLQAGSVTLGDGSVQSLSSIENLKGSAMSDTLAGDANANVIDGGDGDDVISGRAGTDTLLGGSGNDTLDGGADNDTLRGGAGDDALIGGSGTDTADYSDATGPVTVDLTVTAAQNTGGAGTDTLSGIERVVGSNHNDTFAFSNPAAGATYQVDGGGGTNAINLSNFERADAVINKAAGTITLDLGGGQSATIQYSNVASLQFSDGTVLTTSSAPVANAGPDQTVNENDTVTLNASASSDADGDRLTYSWTQTSGPSVSLTGANGATPSFTAPEQLANTALTFQVSVSDGAHTRTDTVTIMVNADNDAPSASAGNDQTVGENAVVQLGGSGSDVEGQNLTYQWVQTAGPSVTLSNASTANPTFTAPEGLSNTDVSFELRVSDGTNTSVDTVTVHVNADNDAPSANAGIDQTVDENAVVQLSGGGSDAEGQNLTYQWVQTAGPSVTLSNATSANPTFTAPEGLSNTDVSFELRVSDGTSVSVDTVAVHINADNDAPSNLTLDNNTIAENSPAGTVVGTLTANDAEGQALTYEIVGGGTQPLSQALAANTNLIHNVSYTASSTSSGSGLGLTSMGRLTDAGGDTDSVWRVRNTSDFDRVVTVTEAGSNISRSFTVPAHSDSYLAMEGTGTHKLMWEGQQVAVKGSGPQTFNSSLPADGPSDKFVMQGNQIVVKPGATLDHEAAGNHNVVVRVTDASGASTTQTFSIYVGDVDELGAASAGADQTVAEGAMVQLSGSGHDPEGQNLTYQWVQTAGPAVQLSDASAANPTFTAPEGLSNTDVSFELRVSDGTNTSVDAVTVHVNADNDAPSANAGIDQTVDENAVVQLSGGGSDAEGQSLTYHWVQTAGPSVTLSDASAANPTFTAPEGLSNTDVSFELRVSDGTNTSVDTVTVHVNADNDAPSANAGPDVDARSGAAVTLRAVTSDIDSATQQIEWVQVAGPAVTLSDAHAASPTFAAPASSQASELRFELRVSDGTNTSIDTVTVRVAAQPIAPPVDVPASPNEPIASPVGVQPEPVPSEPTNSPVIAQPVSAAAIEVQPEAPVPIAPVSIVEPPVAVANPPSAQSDTASSGAAVAVESARVSQPQQSDNAATEWDGTEDLQVLDANDGYEADMDADAIAAAEHIEAVEPALVSMDELFAPTSEIQLAVDRTPAGEIELNPNGARFEQVFRHAGGATGNADESQSNFVAARESNGADGAAQPRPRWAEAPSQSFGANGGVDTGLDEEYVAVGAEEAPPEAEKSAGMFAQLWGLVRGLAGTRGDDADSRNRRR